MPQRQADAYQIQPPFVLWPMFDALLCSHRSCILLRKRGINIHMLAIHHYARTTAFSARAAAFQSASTRTTEHVTQHIEFLPVSLACSRSLDGTSARGKLHKRCSLWLFEGLIHDQPACMHMGFWV